jgi:hypothetical protein
MGAKSRKCRASNNPQPRCCVCDTLLPTQYYSMQYNNKSRIACSIGCMTKLFQTTRNRVYEDLTYYCRKMAIKHDV